MAASAASSVVWYAVWGAAHEGAHVVAAALIGRLDGAGTLPNALTAALGRHVTFPALAEYDCDPWEKAFVRHFAWGCSVVSPEPVPWKP
jgi:hypothetical protein